MRLPTQIGASSSATKPNASSCEWFRRLPARAIVTAAAARKTDLIVMGTHGHGPLMHALMGNVAERVVRPATWLPRRPPSIW